MKFKGRPIGKRMLELMTILEEAGGEGDSYLLLEKMEGVQPTNVAKFFRRAEKFGLVEVIKPKPMRCRIIPDWRKLADEGDREPMPEVDLGIVSTARAQPNSVWALGSMA